jgi:hypothetical protein
MKAFFDWAKREKGLSITQLAAVLGYSERHLYRIRDGETNNLENFEARAVRRLGSEVEQFFLPTVTVAIVASDNLDCHPSEAR